jgi:hypothetical protein
MSRADLLAYADGLVVKLAGVKLGEGHEAATPVLWKYVDTDLGHEFFLTMRLPNVHSPFTGKSLPQHPEKFQIPEVQKELRQVQGPATPVLARAESIVAKLAPPNPLAERAEAIMAKLAATPVLWKYVDSDSGKEFFLPSRMQNVHSPYSGKSMPQRPEKFQIPAIGKELREQHEIEDKPGKALPPHAPKGSPGPKQSGPKAKPKRKTAIDAFREDEEEAEA